MPESSSVYVAGSGTVPTDPPGPRNGPEILGCRRSLNPPEATMLVLTIDSPPVATMVRKLLPFPSVSPLKVTGASATPPLVTAFTVMVEAPPVQSAQTPGPPTNGLMIKSP